MCWYCQIEMYAGYRETESILRCAHCGEVTTPWSDPGGDMYHVGDTVHIIGSKDFKPFTPVLVTERFRFRMEDLFKTSIGKTFSWWGAEVASYSSVKAVKVLSTNGTSAAVVRRQKHGFGWVLKEFSLTTGEEYTRPLCKCGHRHYLGTYLWKWGHHDQGNLWKESGEFVKKGDRVVKVVWSKPSCNALRDGYVPTERILLREEFVVQEVLSCGGALLSNGDIVDWRGDYGSYKVYKIVSKTTDETVVKSFSGKFEIMFDKYGKEVVTLHKKRWNSGRAKRCIDHNPCARRVL